MNCLVFSLLKNIFLHMTWHGMSIFVFLLRMTMSDNGPDMRPLLAALWLITDCLECSHYELLAVVTMLQCQGAGLLLDQAAPHAPHQVSCDWWTVVTWPQCPSLIGPAPRCCCTCCCWRRCAASPPSPASARSGSWGRRRRPTPTSTSTRGTPRLRRRIAGDGTREH